MFYLVNLIENDYVPWLFMVNKLKFCNNFLPERQKFKVLFNCKCVYQGERIFNHIKMFLVF
jgi:hypothetical protein